MLRRDVTCAGGFNGVLYSAVAVQLAQILVDLNSFEDAQLLLVEALRLREDYFGPSHRLVVEALQLLAVALDKMDRTADAQRILERALSILVQLYRTEFNEDIAKTYSQLGMLFFKTGDYPLSITYFKKGIAYVLHVY